MYILRKFSLTKPFTFLKNTIKSIYCLKHGFELIALVEHEFCEVLSHKVSRINTQNLQNLVQCVEQFIDIDRAFHLYKLTQNKGNKQKENGKQKQKKDTLETLTMSHKDWEIVNCLRREKTSKIEIQSQIIQ
jgi:hypothetical protein